MATVYAGALPPHPRSWAESPPRYEETRAAIAGQIDRETLESHNSFLVHVHDWLDFPEGTLKGLSAPLRLPGQPDQLAHVSGTVAERLESVRTLLQTRATASFWSGVDDAVTTWSNGDYKDKKPGGKKPGLARRTSCAHPGARYDSCSAI